MKKQISYICQVKKVLVVRFSSIGDIVLTTPVIRCLKQQVEGVELHFATKQAFKTIVEHNPYIDKLHLLQKELKPLLADLKAENFDLIIDLHNNLRTRIIKLSLGVKSYSFNKLNFNKFLLTNFKINKMPNIHIVDRYLDTAKSLGVENDGKGLDYFIPQKDVVDLTDHKIAENYIGFVLGAKFATKRMPKEKILEVCKLIDSPIVFLGGKEDTEVGEFLVTELGRKNLFNACGKFNLNQSASLVKQAKTIISHDTGLMHIAAAFNKKIISVWGNTVPELGMYQYVSAENKIIVEIEDLNCRPCSKIGYAKCPKKHFDCMNNISANEIAKHLK